MQSTTIVKTIKERLPYVVSIEGDGTNGIDTILACIELKVPIIVALNDFQGQDTDGKVSTSLSHLGTLGPSHNVDLPCSTDRRSIV